MMRGEEMVKKKVKKKVKAKRVKPPVSWAPGTREADGLPYDAIDPDGGAHYYNGVMLPSLRGW